MELHPDRNLHDVEAATRQFSEIQAAYEVLSDGNERAWYDSHRDAFLGGQDDFDQDNAPTTLRNVRLTSTEELQRLVRGFSASIPFDDQPTGFFAIVRKTFDHLALEEEAAAEIQGKDLPLCPTFGHPHDNYNYVVKPFYAFWGGFSTCKSFVWKEKHRLSEAPDRRVRRLMEKENKRCRDDAIREFNDAIHFLVSFIRKRDPRYITNRQTDAGRQKLMRDAAAAQAARSRAANQEKMDKCILPDWVEAREESAAEHTFPSSESDAESEEEVLHCVVCSKTFKSDKQFEAHERSKKHIKAVHQLRRQLQKEGVQLELDAPASPPPGSDQTPSDSGTADMKSKERSSASF